MTSSLNVFLYAGLLGIVFLMTQLSMFKTAFGKAMVALGCVGALFFSILMFISVWTGGPFEVNLVEWFSLGTFNVHVGLYIDEMSAASLVGIGLIVTGVTASFLVQKAREEISPKVSLLILSSLAASLAAVAGNFITFIGGFLVLGLCQSATIGIHFVREERKSNLILFTVVKFSEALIVIGLIGLMSIFGTDLFVTFKEQQATLQEAMRSQVTVFSFCIVVGAMVRTIQFPLIGWIRLIVRERGSALKLIVWSMHIIPIIILFSRLSFIFINMTNLMSVLYCMGSVTLVASGLLALGEKSEKILLAYMYSGLVAVSMILVGLTLFSSALIIFVTTSLCLYVVYLIIEKAPIKKKECKLSELPYMLQVGGLVLFGFSINFFGTPGWGAIERMVRLALSAGKPELFVLVFVIIGYTCLMVAFSRLLITRLVCFGKKWEDVGSKYYTATMVFLLLLLAIITVKEIPMNGVSIDVMSAIEKSTLSRYVGNGYSLMSILFSVLMIFLGPIIVLYIYVIKTDERIQEKFADSFSGIWTIVQRGFFLEVLLEKIFIVIPYSIRSSFLYLGSRKNRFVEKLLVGFSRFAKVFQKEGPVELDNFFLITMVGVLIINGLLVLSFVFKVW